MIVSRKKTFSSAIILITFTSCQAWAAEGGIGTYLLGSKGPSAAVTPGEGWYFQNDLYFYHGRVGGNSGLPLNGKLEFGVDGTAIISLPTIIYVSPASIAGGKLGFTLTTPIGNKDVDAAYSIASPRAGSFSGRQHDNRTSFGDPKIGAFLGWSSGFWHQQISTQINVPIGDYDNGRLANLAFNRWSSDFIGSVTWLNPETGLDISGTLGVTLNGENHATNYKTGNELHFEAAAIQHFNRQFDAGLVGYYYQQISADSGEGASSSFEGRVSAIGLTAGYNFSANKRPVSLRVKYFREFNVANRAEGDVIYLTVSFPLGSKSN